MYKAIANHRIAETPYTHAVEFKRHHVFAHAVPGPYQVAYHTEVPSAITMRGEFAPLEPESRIRHHHDTARARPGITSVEIPKAVGEVSFYCTNAGPANCIHCAAREQNAKKTPIDDRDHK